MSDKRILRIISASILAALLIAFLLPGEYSGRVTAAAVLLPAAIIAHVLVKKRSVLSMYKGQVLVIMGISSAVILTLIYLSGLSFGFYTNPYALRTKFMLGYALPIAIIVAASEYIRYIIRAQGDRAGDVLSYLFCVVAELLIFGNLGYVTSFNRFMDLVGMTLLPAFVANFLYHYLSKRYGVLPNTVYRLVLSLYLYFIPIEAGVPDPLMAFAKLLVPILLFAFIDSLYEKKKRYALVKRSKLAGVITVAAIAVMMMFVMLISNQFRYGTLVIATPSMTGELNVGDAAIFESCENQPIVEGQVIVFEKDGDMIIHRVIEIETVNGLTRYYTKGDANEDRDAGYIHRSNIVGLVYYKVPYVGYPTLWLRSLFSK